MTAKLKNQELQLYAQEHITYECNIVVGQLDALKGALARGEWGGAVHNALVEAVLVHIRLLDDFLRMSASKGDTDDVTAQHYVSSWVPAAVLTGKERRMMNGQLHHLAARRTKLEKWDLDDLVERTATRFLEFLDMMKADQPLRRPWFNDCDVAFGRYL